MGTSLTPRKPTPVVEAEIVIHDPPLPITRSLLQAAGLGTGASR